MTEKDYDEVLAFNRKSCGEQGIFKALKDNDVDVILGPAERDMFFLAAAAGMLAWWLEVRRSS